MKRSTKHRLRSASAFVLLLAAGCVFQFTYSQAWPERTLPLNGWDPFQFTVGASEQWAAKTTADIGGPYSYVSCMNAAGTGYGQLKMKEPYWYGSMTDGRLYNFPENVSHIWTAVHYHPNGSPGAANPYYVWLQRADHNCVHQEWVIVPPAVGGERGRTNGIAVDDLGRVFIVSKVHTGSNSFLHYLLRYQPWDQTWSQPHLLGTAGLPGTFTTANHLRYDAGSDLLVYGGGRSGWMFTIDPDTLNEVGAAQMDFSSFEANAGIRDFQVYADYTIASLDNRDANSINVDSGFAIFEPGGALNMYDPNLAPGMTPFDIGAPKTAFSPAYLPVFFYSSSIPGQPMDRVHEIHIELLSL